MNNFNILSKFCRKCRFCKTRFAKACSLIYTCFHPLPDRVRRADRACEMTVWLYILSGLVAICTVILYAGLLPFEGIAYHTLWCSRFCHNDHTATAQPTKDPNSSWDQLYHLGGNSPWIPKTSGIISSNVSAPENCRVDQVHMVGAARPFDSTSLSDRFFLSL